jgi:hypothetical protein
MFLTRNVLMKYRYPDPEGGGGGGAPPPPAPPPPNPPPQIPENLKPIVQGMIEAAVNEQVAGLKAKNGELIGKEKELKASLAQFEGIDPEAVRTILKRFVDDEEATLIKQGKLDEVLNKRTERMAADWDKKVKAEAARADKLKAKADKLAERAMAESIIKASQKAGALPEATEDIVLRAKGAGWTIDDDGNVIAMSGDTVVFGKDGKTPLTPEEWAASLRENAPHLWPRAQGSGAMGTNGHPKGGPDLSKLSPEARITHFRGQQAVGGSR